MHVSVLDVYQPRETWLHHLDPRVKLLVTVFFILTAVTLPEGAWISYALLIIFLLALSWTAKLGLSFTLRRGFIALPFVLTALPLIFLTPGEILFTLPGLGWTITGSGVARVMAILVRTWIAVQAGILMSATSSVSDLLWGLERVRVPRIIVATVGFMVRYLFVLVDEALRMLRARASRSPRLEGVRTPGIFWQGRTAGMMVGSLFLRSLERSERVYAAMLSRGYDGRLRMLEPSKIESRDWAALVLALLVLAGVYMIGSWS